MKNKTTHYWDGQNIVLSTNINNYAKAIYLRSCSLVSQNIGANAYFYLHSAHGDITQRIMANGDSTPVYQYSAFGVEREMNDNDINPFRYCGEYYEKETEEIYLRNRYYDSRTGRFNQEDPIRSGLNWYNYGSNNPIKYIDPLGTVHLECSDDNNPLTAHWTGKEYVFSDGTSWKPSTSSNSSSSSTMQSFSDGGEVWISNIFFEAPSNRGIPWQPNVVNLPGNRSRSAYQYVLKSLNAGSNYRYIRTETDTWCNIFVWDATTAMGVEIPHYYDPNTGMKVSKGTDGNFPSGYYEMNANRMCDWFENFGNENGWIEVTEADAQYYANNGYPVVAAVKVVGGTGHVAMVHPQQGNDIGTNQIVITNVGATNFDYGTIESGFGSFSQTNQIKYYYHE